MTILSLNVVIRPRSSYQSGKAPAYLASSLLMRHAPIHLNAHIYLGLCAYQPVGPKARKQESKQERKQERPSKRHHLCRAIHSCGPRQHHPSVAGLAAEQANRQPGRHLVAWSLRSLAPRKQEASNDRARGGTSAKQPAAEQAASCGALLLERIVVGLVGPIE